MESFGQLLPLSSGHVCLTFMPSCTALFLAFAIHGFAAKQKAYPAG
ncbi:MAG: hypothetical protein FWF95_04715 [Syntrophorhabdaceae bacterium]|nr:hypothetical protein [Syntrophorhabdaceae bacterium]